MQEIKCIFRSHLFDGYTTTVDMGLVECVDDIITLAVSKLYEFLRTNNLMGLIKHLDMETFKIDLTLEQILGKPEAPVIIEEFDDDSSSSDVK